jgi:hypothetical protein
MFGSIQELFSHVYGRSIVTRISKYFNKMTNSQEHFCAVLRHYTVVIRLIWNFVTNIALILSVPNRSNFFLHLSMIQI